MLSKHTLLSGAPPLFYSEPSAAVLCFQASFYDYSENGKQKYSACSENLKSQKRRRKHNQRMHAHLAAYDFRFNKIPYYRYYKVQHDKAGSQPHIARKSAEHCPRYQYRTAAKHRKNIYNRYYRGG